MGDVFWSGCGCAWEEGIRRYKHCSLPIHLTTHAHAYTSIPHSQADDLIDLTRGQREAGGTDTPYLKIDLPVKCHVTGCQSPHGKNWA